MKKHEVIQTCKNKHQANKRAFLMAIAYPENKYIIEDNKVIQVTKSLF